MSRDFWRERTIKARKPHCCEECGETIKTGEKYVRIAGKYQGDFSAYPLCSICHACIPQWDYSDHEVEYNVRDMITWYQDELEGVPESNLPEHSVRPPYRQELLRLCNLLRKTRGMTPLEVTP